MCESEGEIVKEEQNIAFEGNRPEAIKVVRFGSFRPTRTQTKSGRGCFIMLIYCSLRYRALFDCATKTFPLFFIGVSVIGGKINLVCARKKTTLNKKVM